MAGAGYKLFNTGDVLTAAQVNTYLQEQVVMVFANAAARTTALSGVLAEGMVSYLKDTDALEIYSGAAWVGYGSGDITGITTGATSGLTGGVTSGTADLKFNTTGKGGLLVGTGSGTVSELTVGSNNQVLTADSTTATGLKWATAAGGGKVLQVVQDTDQTGFSTSSSSYVDTTMSVSITPSAATSKVLIFVSLPAYARAGVSGTNAYGAFNIVRGATQITQFNYGNVVVSNAHEHITPFTIVYLDSPSTTSATTYKVQAKKLGGSDINYEGANFNASITCMEIGA